MTDKTDREMLELAAKAAGIEWFGYYRDDITECQYLDIGTNEVVPWNPLDDDGDALRLAMRLKLCVATHEYRRCRRRAIVRAAAEIGKETK